MIRFLIAVAVCVFLLPFAVVGQEKKTGDDEEKIVGAWRVTKGEGLPDGTTLDLTKDGKVTFVLKHAGQTITVHGKYVLKDQELRLTLDPPARQSSYMLKVKSLTDSELTTIDMEKRTDVFTKKKK